MTNKRIQEPITTPPHCYKGFTLAETLITLVIVGVVAALTIPNLIVKYQKEQTVTRLKKVYSTLSQTLNRAIADNGPINTWEIPNKHSFATQELQAFTQKYFLPYLSVQKYCYVASECSKLPRYYLNGSSNGFYSGPTTSGTVSIILNDGSYLYMWMIDGNVRFWVDINGDKKPNVFGKDVFSFVILINQNSFELEYINKSRSEILNSCKKGTAGWGCGALIQKDGWKISDDYPW